MSTGIGHLGGNRTPIHGVAVRCIAILPLGENLLAIPEGFEPPTSSSANLRSIQLSYGTVKLFGIGTRIRTLTYSFGDCRAKPLTLFLHCTNKKAPNTFMLGALNVIKKSRQDIRPLPRRQQVIYVVLVLIM